ncbi:MULTISPECIES: hypothetical protein [unclassified Bradyrhizobium]|uniref:hypothetical protein n=1 Tax=unclassified Bradyrhizobium TaxID=2631580 RepID=UPI002FF37224
MNIAVTTPLPALIDRARQALANARTAAEILEAKDEASIIYDIAKKAARMAAAKGAHDEVVAAAHRAQGDALELEAGAKHRLADEYDAAQERGEINGHGGDRKTDEFKFESSKLEGIKPDQLHEARIIRDAEAADPGIVRRSIDERLAQGEEPTKAALRQVVTEAAMRGHRAGTGAGSSNKNPNYQPPSKADVPQSDGSNPPGPAEVAGLANALRVGLCALDPIIDRIDEIGLPEFWKQIGSKAARQELAVVLDGLYRLRAIERAYEKLQRRGGIYHHDFRDNDGCAA